MLFNVNPNLIDHSESRRAFLGALDRSNVNQVRSYLRDIKSIESVDRIHPNHSN